MDIPPVKVTTPGVTPESNNMKRPINGASIISDNIHTVTLTTQNVTKKIKKNELFIHTVSSRSHVWKVFGNVCDAKGDYIGFVACVTCKYSYKYCPRTTGTSTLAKHKCNISKNQPLLVANTFKTISLNSNSLLMTNI